MQLIPDDGGAAPVGAGVFSLVQGGMLTTESGVPTALSTTRARIYVDTTAGHDTGIAVAAASAVGIRVEAFGSDPTTPQAPASSSSLETALRANSPGLW